MDEKIRSNDVSSLDIISKALTVRRFFGSTEIGFDRQNLFVRDAVFFVRRERKHSLISVSPQVVIGSPIVGKIDDVGRQFFFWLGLSIVMFLSSVQEYVPLLAFFFLGISLIKLVTLVGGLFGPPMTIIISNSGEPIVSISHRTTSDIERDKFIVDLKKATALAHDTWLQNVS